ncbi:YolD-like protein [compost metagenome]
MGDKLNGDGLWASRMMLPEHKEALLRKNQEPLRRAKPALDGQELEQIEHTLAESYHDHRSIKIQLFDEYEQIEVCGIVTAVQTYRREIKVHFPGGDAQWIPLNLVLSAELQGME